MGVGLSSLHGFVVIEAACDHIPLYVLHCGSRPGTLALYSYDNM